MNTSSFFGLLAISAFIVIVFSAILYMASRYKRCPSDKILVIYGKVDPGKSSRCMHGGGTIVWPLIQSHSYMSLTPMTINIPLQGALSQQNIRINVPSTFTVGISTQPEIMTNAAERLLGLGRQETEEMAKEIIFGQLRLTVASLTIEQINQDRESFLESIRRNVEPELNKIGLYLINVNVTDITDESDYIGSIGKKAASEAINKARVDVAEQEKFGAIGTAEANREKDIRVAENVASAEKGRKKAEADQRIYVQAREAEAIDGENTAAAEIAISNANLAIKEAEAKQRAEIARRIAEEEIQKAQYRAELERLTAAEVVQKEVDKKKMEITAEAEAERTRRIAKGDADGILLKYNAQAEGIQRLLQSKAEGYRKLVDSVHGDSQAAATLLMIEKMEDLIGAQVEAISKLKIDKITVWDSGNNGGSSTANFISGLVKSVPPLQDLAAMAGIELPDYLGKKIQKPEEKEIFEPESTQDDVIEEEKKNKE